LVRELIFGNYYIGELSGLRVFTFGPGLLEGMFRGKKKWNN